MCRMAELGFRATQCTSRIDELGRAVVVPAAATVVARLIGRVAIRTLATDESVGQEGSCFWIVELFDVALHYQPSVTDRRPNVFTEGAVLGAIGAAVIVELDVERREVALVRLLHTG